MIARVEFEYTDREKMIALAATEEGYAQLKAIFNDGTPEPKEIGSMWAWPDNTLIDIETDGQALAALGISFRVRNFKGTLPLKALLPNGGDYHIHVQIPHVGLLAVDEVQVIEDACTDNLQRELDRGWRILCVCPPNAARRPDYVMGRTRGTDK